MIRCYSICFLLLLPSCTSQLKVITEDIDYVNPSDFSDTSRVVPTSQRNEIIVELVEEPVAGSDEVVLIEDPYLEIEEPNDAMMPRFVGVPVTVEALVGQVNGRPVYANTVLGPVADQIEAASRKLSRTEFADEIRSALYSETNQMGTTIRGGRMYELVITDLLLSEAVGGMSIEQSYGLLSIVQQMRDDLASSQRGSQSQLRQLLSQQAGVSVDEFLELQRDQILIDALYRQKIWPKVNVTWRDIQREFEQVSLGEEILQGSEDVERTEIVLSALQSGISLGNIDAAKGSVTLGMIRLSKEDPLISQVNDSFSTGASFKEVATQVGVDNEGIWDTFEMGLGGISDIQVGAAIKKRLVDVAEGDILEPFELGSSLVWIAILEVQQPISLYNSRVQIAMHNALRWVQFNREKDRYVESLWGDGSLEEVKSMSEQVKNIAVRRYQQ